MKPMCVQECGAQESAGHRVSQSQSRDRLHLLACRTSGSALLICASRYACLCSPPCAYLQGSLLSCVVQREVKGDDDTFPGVVVSLELRLLYCSRVADGQWLCYCISWAAVFIQVQGSINFIGARISVSQIAAELSAHSP